MEEMRPRERTAPGRERRVGAAKAPTRARAGCFGNTRRGVLLAALCGLLLGPFAALPGHAEFEEQQVMAAFLFNFVKLVTWPEEAFGGADAPIRVAVLGDDSFRALLVKSIQGKEAGGRTLEVVGVASIPEASSAQVLFLPASQGPRAAMVESLVASHVLTVADAESFARDGGMVAFVREGNKLRFEINESAAKKAGLSVSSRLLRVAKQVH